MSGNGHTAFGPLLRDFRLAAGLSQEELAERAGLSVSGISVLERGVRRGAHRVTVDLLAAALALSEPERARLETAGVPPPSTRRRNGATGTPPERHNLPFAVSSFRGRETEMAALAAEIRAHRLVTITGAGGLGKTRLAIETAHGLVDMFPDGVRLVELAPLAEPELVAARVAAALGVSESFEAGAGDGWMRELVRRRLLLILDNCEHVLAATAELAQRLLERCPALHILATSREALRVAGERVVRLDPLDVPRATPGAPLAPADLRRWPSVALFLDRARDAAPDFTIEPDDTSAWQALETICTRLDGMPLAIELAAARTSSLRLDTLAQALERSLLTVGAARAASPRQKTLRSLLDWSYDLLSDEERKALRRLAIFAGGWTIEAAEAVCAGDCVPAGSALTLLSLLVDKSLVAVDVRAVPARYRMLETTRAYARERLAESGEADAIARSHADYFRALLDRADAAYAQPTVAAWLAPLAREIDNFRAALRWSLGEGGDVAIGAQIAAAQTSVLDLLSFLTEATQWCEAALAALGTEPEPALEAPLQLALAECFTNTGYAAPTVVAASRAAELYRTRSEIRTIGYAGNRAALAFALAALAHALINLGRDDEADAAATEAVRVAREEGGTAALALVIKSRTVAAHDLVERRALLAEALELSENPAEAPTLGLVLMFSCMAEYDAGNFKIARAYARDAVDFFRRNGVREHFAVSALSLAALSSLAAGDMETAYADAHAALTQAHRGPFAIRAAVHVVAHIAASRGRYAEAARLLGGCDALFAHLGTVRLLHDPRRERTLAQLGLALRPDEMASFVAEGRAWSVEQIAAAALAV